MPGRDAPACGTVCFNEQKVRALRERMPGPDALKATALGLVLTLGLVVGQLPRTALSRSVDDPGNATVLAAHGAAAAGSERAKGCCAEEAAASAPAAETPDDAPDDAPCCPDGCEHCDLPCCGGMPLAFFLPEAAVLRSVATALPTPPTPTPPSIQLGQIFHPPRA